MKTYHVYPLNDTKAHITEPVDVPVYNPVTRQTKTRIQTNCECKPTIHYEHNGNITIVHNSFDGRENFEWDNKVREN